MILRPNLVTESQMRPALNRAMPRRFQKVPQTLSWEFDVAKISPAALVEFQETRLESRLLRDLGIMHLEERNLMNPVGNTILITGGGSGIGRGLAESLHALGNQVIVAGRRQKALDETTAANPGMKSLIVDTQDPVSIRALAARVSADFPALNVLVNNAGIMRAESLLAQQPDLADAEAIIATNLLGPIRLTAALLPHLQKQPRATVLNVSSGLAFMPMARTPTYCATKAAIHSYTVSLRAQLRNTNIEVLELIPPYVATDLMDGANNPRAMPLDKFITEAMAILTTAPTPPEICVENVKGFRFAAENGNFDMLFARLNATFLENH